MKIDNNNNSNNNSQKLQIVIAWSSYCVHRPLKKANIVMTMVRNIKGTASYLALPPFEATDLAPSRTDTGSAADPCD